jgi:2-keto-4-pentenoate hydratase/2-oxohepta-3-ene-1,7-dioic acid hydratase in catechol pathway
MRLVTFSNASCSQPRVGAIVAGTHLLDLCGAAGGDRAAQFSDMVGLIDAVPRGALDHVRELILSAEKGRCDPFMIPLNHAKIFAPIPAPRKNVFCVGLNYLDHVKEGEFAQDKVAKFPEFFTKAPTCIRANLDEVPSHPETTKMLDYEGELGVIIGKAGINIAEDAWDAHVFGYTIINDITGRDLQHSHRQWFKGKSLDGSCPMGPCIVTKDEVVDAQSVKITTTVNGEVRQNTSTAKMIFKLPCIIAELSNGMTIEPGDIIATGTPSGVGYAMKPPSFLKPGDEVVVAIEGLGELRNRIG